ncbi:MAG: Asp-tRNA(Asn)/Glu-tRNA(Gln) amidotransferase subunit GatC [Patescibacteria group bacterium]
MITLKEIEKLALLSRIDLAPEEKEAFRKDMDAILGYVEQVQKVSGALDVNKKAGNLRNVLREDANPHESGIHTETLISAAPKREGNRVKVKKIL